MAKILICDDDAAMVGMIRDMLELEGYDVSSAGDPAELAAQIGRQVPDLVMLDMSMPGGGGPAAFKHLRANAPTARVPVLVVSSMPIAEQKRWFGEDRLISYLQKPFQVQQLCDTVGKLLSPGA